MARDDDDIEKLLADVQRSLGGESAPPSPAKRGEDKPAKSDSSRSAALPTALVVAVVAAVVNWVIFWFVPFVGAASAAWGAFVTAFALTLISRLRRR